MSQSVPGIMKWSTSTDILNRTAAAALLLLSLCSCSDDSEPEIHSPESGDQITFAVANGRAGSRAVTVYDDATSLGYFFIKALNNIDDTPRPYIQMMRVNGTEKSWTDTSGGTPTVYKTFSPAYYCFWPKTGTLDILAYRYGDNTELRQDGSDYFLDMEQPSDVTRQLDPIVASKFALSEKKPIALEFQHVMGKIEFTAYIQVGYYAELTKVTLKNVCNKASYSFMTGKTTTDETSRIDYTFAPTESLTWDPIKYQTENGAEKGIHIINKLNGQTQYTNGFMLPEQLLYGEPSVELEGTWWPAYTSGDKANEKIEGSQGTPFVWEKKIANFWRGPHTADEHSECDSPDKDKWHYCNDIRIKPGIAMDMGLWIKPGHADEFKSATRSGASPLEITINVINR